MPRRNPKGLFHSHESHQLPAVHNRSARQELTRVDFQVRSRKLSINDARANTIAKTIAVISIAGTMPFEILPFEIVIQKKKGIQQPAVRLVNFQSRDLTDRPSTARRTKKEVTGR